ncbi:uncharacterized protein LOC115886792 isoform X2 [Sitophilus oryzae]|nr:uncharacterized protein LOC115886792 isoform X2 [Sitophilus oryzae]
MTTVNCQKPVAFDTSPLIFDIPYPNVTIYPVISHLQSNRSFLHSQKLKHSILQSKKAFLHVSIEDQKPEDEQMEEKSIVLGQLLDHKRTVPKKISFKIKKQSSLHKRNVGIQRIANIPTNKVAELTKKFNEMVENQNVSREQMRMLVKRGDSDTDKVKRTLVQREGSKVSRKPSVKTKPALEGKNLVIIKTKPVRKSSIKRQGSWGREKLTETPIQRPTTLSLNRTLNVPKAIIETSPNGTSVRAAIEIFEKKSAVTALSPTKPETKTSTLKPSPKPKPEIPEKSATLRDFRRPSPNATPVKAADNSHLTQTDSGTTNKEPKEESGEFGDEEIVQIINIPAVLPQRRCDSMYETLHLRKIPTDSLKSKSVDNINKELRNSSIQPNCSFLWREKSSTSTRTSFSEVGTPEDTRKLPPDIPPKPNVDTKPALPPKLMGKRPVSSIKTNCDNDTLADYEEIGSSVTINDTNDEKFKGYDEITKPVNEMEVMKTEKLYEEIIRPDSPSKEVPEEKYYEEIIKNSEEKIYEELKPVVPIRNDDGYEPICSNLPEKDSGRNQIKENIYETLPAHSIPSRLQEPLPPRPPSSTRQEENVYNCYESIYTESRKDGYYESINGSQLTDSGSNRDSVLSSDHKSNSLYGKPLPMWDVNVEGVYYKTASDFSSDRVSDRSDEWEDMSDNDDEKNKFIIVRERQRMKKSGWSELLSKTSKISGDQLGEETDHYYETLNTAKFDDFDSDDSFESDIESEMSYDRADTVDDSGIDIGNHQLPNIPNSQGSGLIKFAGRHMKKLKQNWTRDISKSLTRMKKHMSKTDTDSTASKDDKKSDSKSRLPTNEPDTRSSISKNELSYQNVDIPKNAESQPEDADRSKTLTRKAGFLTKFRRSMSLSAESANELTSNLAENKTKSTFYVTDTINIDKMDAEQSILSSTEKLVSPVMRKSRSSITRPNSPPPPAPSVRPEPNPARTGKTSSWYAESGLFRDTSRSSNKRPNTYWYAEVGLYELQASSAASTSSSENSGSNLSTPIKPLEISRPVLKSSDFINQDDQETVNNMKNDNIYYAGSNNSTDTKNDESLKQEIQLRLQDEPLYQFYDAAIQESVSYDTMSDFDSDNYEDVIDKDIANQNKLRPSAMELVSPKRNSVCFNKTLWCEIPEVINSTVLSSLSVPQKKLQEAKFEILTSEASYLNSLNVLTSHFIKNLSTTNLLTAQEKDILFGHVESVRSSSEKLLHDIEKCWQDNILLYGICDIVQKHAEENFNVYIQYCENQVLFDEVLKVLKDRLGFSEFLSHLELSEVCQSLTLYSFLMLPMQRITRWPLLVEAVLKRLPQQDPEYFACHYAMVAVNKIVSQCNEAARNKERETELKKISRQLEFPQNVPITPIFITERYLVRCGPVTHIQTRNEDTKLTFGKRCVKSTVHLFLFNDLLIVSKEKSENSYNVMHYCPRNLVELNTSELLAPLKDTQGKNMLLLTVLENQNGKSVEFLLSCNSESDKERWIEALTPPKSQDPEETLYEVWDCPQVSAVHNYTATQPDELSLTKGDVINVLRKLADGWYHGEKIRNGQMGWFPANHTVEIANIHVRARNLRQRHKFLAFSENYLKSK